VRNAFESTQKYNSRLYLAKLQLPFARRKSFSLVAQFVGQCGWFMERARLVVHDTNCVHKMIFETLKTSMFVEDIRVPEANLAGERTYVCITRLDF
jgi:hypothetical protein